MDLGQVTRDSTIERRPGDGLTEKTAFAQGLALAKAGGAIIIGGSHGSLAVARSLGRHGIPVWFLETSRSLTGYSRYVTKRMVWPGSDSPGAAQWLVLTAGANHLKSWMIFPAGDAEVRFIAENHELLSRHFTLITQPWHVLEAAQDKNRLYARAEALAVACPKAISHGKPENFPVIIKPATREETNALTLAKAWQADDAESFRQLYPEAVRLMRGAEHVVVQDLVPGDGRSQFSYAAVWDNGRPVASLVARRSRQYPIDFGFTSTCVETVNNPEIEAAAVRLLRSLDYHGLVEVEFKHDARDGLDKVLDINARMWTWIGLGDAAGVDFPWIMWQVATGHKPAFQRGRAGVQWRHFSRDAVAAVFEAVKGRRGLFENLRSLLPHSTGAAFAWDDPLPGLMDMPLVLPRLVRRIAAARKSRAR
jgi:predicted ATP-grasp superfamily ATP-dependent carboligase